MPNCKKEYRSPEQMVAMRVTNNVFFQMYLTTNKSHRHTFPTRSYTSDGKHANSIKYDIHLEVVSERNSTSSDLMVLISSHARVRFKNFQHIKLSTRAKEKSTNQYTIIDSYRVSFSLRGEQDGPTRPELSINYSQSIKRMDCATSVHFDSIFESLCFKNVTVN